MAKVKIVLDEQILDDMIRGARNRLKQAKLDNKKFKSSTTQEDVMKARWSLSYYGELKRKHNGGK